MTHAVMKGLLTVLLKLYGLTLAVGLVGSISGVYLVLRSTDPSAYADSQWFRTEWSAVLGMGLPILLYALLAVVFIFFTGPVVNLLLGKERDGVPGVAAGWEKGLLRTGVTLVALYWLVRSARTLVSMGANGLFMGKMFGGRYHQGDMIANGLILILAAVLLYLFSGRELVRPMVLRWRERKRRGERAAKEVRHCPHCGSEYHPGDYRDDLAHIYCVRCKKEIEKTGTRGKEG